MFSLKAVLSEMPKLTSMLKYIDTCMYDPQKVRDGETKGVVIKYGEGPRQGNICVSPFNLKGIENYVCAPPLPASA